MELITQERLDESRSNNKKLIILSVIMGFVIIALGIGLAKDIKIERNEFISAKWQAYEGQVEKLITTNLVLEGAIELYHIEINELKENIQFMDREFSVTLEQSESLVESMRNETFDMKFNFENLFKDNTNKIIKLEKEKELLIVEVSKLRNERKVWSDEKVRLFAEIGSLEKTLKELQSKSIDLGYGIHDIDSSGNLIFSLKDLKDLKGSTNVIKNVIEEVISIPDVSNNSDDLPDLRYKEGDSFILKSLESSDIDMDIINNDDLKERLNDMFKGLSELGYRDFNRVNFDKLLSEFIKQLEME